jgi:cytochrome c oxidase assembly factor CtaG
VLVAFVPLAASAHSGEIVAPGDLLSRWRLDPAMSLLLLLTGWCYWRGTARINRIAKAAQRAPVISGNRQCAFWTGLLVLAGALDSPLDTATATVFSAHMIQHMLLLAVAPPLLLTGRPLPAIMRGLPQSVRRFLTNTTRRWPRIPAVLGWLALPVVAWLLQAFALWLWHVPVLYQSAVRHQSIHLLEHASFVVTALLYWWAIVPASRHATNLDPGIAMLSLFAMGMQGAALGALLTFSGTVWYPIYEHRSELWGFSALSDQRLAGLTMWIPAGSVYVVAALVVLGMWLNQDRPTSGIDIVTS